MNADTVVDLARTTLMLIIKCGAPMLLSSLVVGLIVSVVQTITSIQEQTLTFVPKLLVTFLVLILTGGWILTELSDFTTALFDNFSNYVNTAGMILPLLW